MKLWKLLFVFMKVTIVVHAQIGSSCYTHYKESGTCISIRKCRPIWKILTDAPRPLPDRIVDYVRGSQCGNSQDRTICCRHQDIDGGSTTTETPNIYRDHETQNGRTTERTGIYHEQSTRRRNDESTTQPTNIYLEQSRPKTSTDRNDRRYDNSQSNIGGYWETSTTRRTTTTRSTVSNLYYPNGFEEQDHVNSNSNARQTTRTTRRPSTTRVSNSNHNLNQDSPSSNNQDNYYQDSSNRRTTSTTSRNVYPYPNEYTTESYRNYDRNSKDEVTNLIPGREQNRQDRAFNRSSAGAKRDTDASGVSDVTEHTNLNLFDLRTCGPVSFDRIANGNHTDIFEYPWMAILGYHNSISELQFKCGGTLITKRYVLTAAHCVTQLPRGSTLTTVRLGEYDLSRQVDCEYMYDERICMPEAQDIGIQTIVFHLEFNQPKYSHDVALIRLRDDADFSHPRIRTICLPLTEKLLGTVPKNYVITGWGNTETGSRSEKLQQAILPAFPKDRCKDVLSTISRGLSLNDGHFCAGGEENVDSCGGDSGGEYFRQVISS